MSCLSQWITKCRKDAQEATCPLCRDPTGCYLRLKEYLDLLQTMIRSPRMSWWEQHKSEKRSATYGELHAPGSRWFDACKPEVLLPLIEYGVRSGYSFEHPRASSDPSLLLQALWSWQPWPIIKALLDAGANPDGGEYYLNGRLPRPLLEEKSGPYSRPFAEWEKARGVCAPPGAKTDWRTLTSASFKARMHGGSAEDLKAAESAAEAYMTSRQPRLVAADVKTPLRQLKNYRDVIDAIKSGQVDAVRVALDDWDRLVHSNIVMGSEPKDPLHHAILTGNLDLVKLVAQDPQFHPVHDVKHARPYMWWGTEHVAFAIKHGQEAIAAHLATLPARAQ
jgi:hypothetical protein